MLFGIYVLLFLYDFCESCVVWVLLFLHVFLVSCVLSRCCYFMCFLLLPVCTKLFERVVRLPLSFSLTPLHLSLTLSIYENCHREERAGQRGVMEKMLFGTLREVEVGRS